MTADNKPRLIQEGPYFAQLWESVLFDPELNPSAIVVYACLQRYAMEQGGDAIFPSQQEIADRLNMNRDTVGDSLKKLADRKHITREMQGTRWVVTLKQPKPMRKNSAYMRNFSALSAEKSGTPTSNRESKEFERGASAKKGSRLPNDWEPSAELRGWALDDLGLTEDNLTYQTDQFCDYWHAKAGQAATKVDWDLTFKTWMRKAKEEQGGKRLNGNGHRALNNDEKRPIPQGMPDYLTQAPVTMSPGKLSELRALRGKT